MDGKAFRNNLISHKNFRGSIAGIPKTALYVTNRLNSYLAVTILIVESCKIMHYMVKFYLDIYLSLK